MRRLSSSPCPAVSSAAAARSKCPLGLVVGARAVGLLAGPHLVPHDAGGIDPAALQVVRDRRGLAGLARRLLEQGADARVQPRPARPLRSS